jgi:hypothetical protein
MTGTGRLRRLRSPDERPLLARRRHSTPEPPRGLGGEFVVSSKVLKRYPCHATAHAAVRAVCDLQAAYGFSGSEVEAITVTGTTRMVERYNILEPADLMLAQYSIPFCVALALHRGAASMVTIALADGRRLEGRAENGMLEPGELEDKFRRLTCRALGEPGAAALFERLQRIEDEADLSWIGAQP